MGALNLSEQIDKRFPRPKSNRGYQPSEFIKTFILMQHEGSFRLDDIRHLQDDEALRTVLDIKKLPGDDHPRRLVEANGRPAANTGCLGKGQQSCVEVGLAAL